MRRMFSKKQINQIVNEGIESGLINSKLKIELVESFSVENVSGAIPITKEVLDKVGDLFIIEIESNGSVIYSGLCSKSPILLLGYSEDTDYDSISLDIDNEPPLIFLTNYSIEGDFDIKVYSISL